VLDASYIIIGTRAVRVTIDFRIYARVLLEIAREKEREKERLREIERERERERKRERERLSLASPYIPSLVKISRKSGCTRRRC